MTRSPFGYRVGQRVEINVAAINATPRWMAGCICRIWPEGDRANVYCEGRLFTGCHVSSMRTVRDPTGGGMSVATDLDIPAPNAAEFKAARKVQSEWVHKERGDPHLFESVCGARVDADGDRLTRDWAQVTCPDCREWPL